MDNDADETKDSQNKELSYDHRVTIGISKRNRTTIQNLFNNYSWCLPPLWFLMKIQLIARNDLLAACSLFERFLVVPPLLLNKSERTWVANAR